METLILVRHAHARSNEGGRVSGVPPGETLSEQGVAEAQAAAEAIARLAPELGVVSRLSRSEETLSLLAPGLPAIVVPELDEIGFGRFEGGTLEDYRAWAWTAPPDEPCPGGGESRAAAALRLAAALELLLARPERTVVAVSHAMPIRYVLDASAGLAPARRLPPVGHAEPHLLDRAALRHAQTLLRAWSQAPAFRDDPGASGSIAGRAGIGDRGVPRAE